MNPESNERSACGVGFVASTSGRPSHLILAKALMGLECVEHRGGQLADGRTGDGAGIMAEVPFELFGYAPGEVAVATLFVGLSTSRQRDALRVFEETFEFLDMPVVGYRKVPVDTSVLGRQARETMPAIVQAFIRRPDFCRKTSSFNALLHRAKQKVRTRMTSAGFSKRVFFASLSTSTIVYKALTRAADLPKFYPDLVNPAFETRFAMFHRRFSTNTRTSWDKAQPFRMIAHNGEINTIECNRAWSISREKACGIPKDELLTHSGISDSGSLNEMVEALRHRGGIPRLDEILAIMVPPASGAQAPFYKFWSRAVEPWDGPAFLAFSDGAVVGARLDRNGFRPCRWARTNDAFYLASEAGIFGLDEAQILEKGALLGGSGAHLDLDTGEVSFDDPSTSRRNNGATFDARLEPVGVASAPEIADPTVRATLFGYAREDIEAVLAPMSERGKEPIGSMGDTARPAIFSSARRSFFDYFFQTFAQVTNPPLDHMRERFVTDLSTYLGARPNVFATKELLPPTPGIELSSPVLSASQMAWLERAAELSPNGRSYETQTFSITFARVRGPSGLGEALDRLADRVLDAIRGGCSILILSDRLARPERPPIPSLLALRAADQVLTQWGHRLDVSIVVDTAEVRSTHQLAALIGYGAAAVCPYLAFELARSRAEAAGRPTAESQENLRVAFEQGLLKIMSKMGISTVRGYQGSRLFTAYGVGQPLLDRFFSGQRSPLGGVGLSQVAARILEAPYEGAPTPLYVLRENKKGLGEPHSMTSALSRALHAACEDSGPKGRKAFNAYAHATQVAHPISPRHLLDLHSDNAPIPLEDVQSAAEIMRTFGSGAMSFGAISAESQRDIIVAMRQVGGRSASGEGGENPFYFVDGTTASTKQIASGRFGVTAEYLVSGDEIEIKVAQGAKPGEGGQLMAVKVDEHIARARHSNPGVDLISPPPLHDIYSIEDLRELIYELKQLRPKTRVAVKLVSGANIGTIAAGVVKAGADLVQISGGDGGTGAASISSMKHAGLPWELGLVEVHKTLVEQDLREHVVLRVDGGLSTGADVVKAALLGAEEFGFGKLLLIAEGCIMARVCEKNTCPRGIATHDPKYKAKYRGQVSAIVNLLKHLAEDVRVSLAALGVARLEQLVGRGDWLAPAARHSDLIAAQGLDLARLSRRVEHQRGYVGPLVPSAPSRLNARIAEDVAEAVSGQTTLDAEYLIDSTDRAALATASGWLAYRTMLRRLAGFASGATAARDLQLPSGALSLTLTGSAGQGFAAFLVSGLQVLLQGEANDSVAKSMSGGQVIVRPHPNASFEPERASIIGNGALYGATGGTLFVRGRAGDRFAVRNSGATAVVEGVGLHACEYMTRGTVVILRDASYNVGAGMTGGVLFLHSRNVDRLNTDYLVARPLDPEDRRTLEALLVAYRAATGSASVPDELSAVLDSFVCCVPRGSAVQASPAAPLA